MVTQKIKRLGIPIITFWVLCGSYLYVFFGNRDLFEYITLLIIWLYVMLDIKRKWKYIILFFMIWNVLEESALIMSNDWNAASWLFVYLNNFYIRMISIGGLGLFFIWNHSKLTHSGKTN